MDAPTAYGPLLLSLGLAKTDADAQGIVRLACEFGPADRDADTNAQAMIMLLANQSLAGLGQFGLSADAVRAKRDALVTSGMDSQAAFVAAVLEAAQN